MVTKYNDVLNIFKDDYLDCYGDPAVFGKIGRDIEENKCSWLIVQSLPRATPAQRALFDKHYGIDNPEDVQVIKRVYGEIGIPGVSFIVFVIFVLLNPRWTSYPW
jgi:geranylgeranyl pyrophosphate synthase